MKESITKFDLEAAFKALDDLDIPVAERGIRSNKPALNEIFSRKTKFDALFEEYYDIGSTEDLGEAQDAREAEIAKAKLARIEKIVDLDASSPDELLSSYVGKYIIQCPQCMTLFYKNQEDVETSEDDESVVNVNEICQHCGNESGYTLIGKVGAAEEPAEDVAAEADAEATEEPTEEPTEEVGGDEAATEEGGTEEGGTEEFDLDAELAALEGEEETETTEESFANKSEGNYLLEQLEEEAEPEDIADESDMDISDAEFKELLDSAEFSKPVSSKAAQAMLDNMDEALVPSEDLEEALDEEDQEALEEAGFFKNLGKLGKAAFQGAKKAGNKANTAFGELADKALDKSMTREEKADWVMKNTLMPSVKEVEIDNEGNAIPDERDRKFDTYLIIGYKGYYSDGKTIGMSPTKTNKDLVIGMSEPQFRETYTEAEELAKGWSMDQKGGPAFIMLTKGKDLGNAAYLCQYFKGELDTKQDQLENYFQAAKKDLEGKAHISKGGGVKGDQQGPKTEERAVSALKVGDVIVLGKEGAKILEITESKFQAGSFAIKVQLADGDTDSITFAGTQKVTAVISTEASESFAKAVDMPSLMEQLDELNEQALEALISKSLVEAYKNVAGFRLSDCQYLNESLVVNGNVFFESGNVRPLTYTFNSAAVKKDKVALRGLCEKLGKDKFFYVVGKTTGKEFIAESFKTRNQ